LLIKFYNRIKYIKSKIMKKEITRSGPSGAVYGLGLIGAAVYFISQATGFWMGVLGFLKALVWPAFLVYQAFAAMAK
jgi:hypothetical protein